MDYSPTRLMFCLSSHNGHGPHSRTLALTANGSFMASLAASASSIINSFKASQSVMEALQSTHDLMVKVLTSLSL